MIETPRGEERWSARRSGWADPTAPLSGDGASDGASPRDRRRQTVLACVLLVIAVSAGLRLWNLSSPGEYMFDEVYYAKDAKAMLDGRMDPKRDYPWEPGDVVSWAHPDAGKMAIAAGVAIFGDRPLGWRLPAVVAGLVLLACVYPIARRLGLRAVGGGQTLRLRPRPGRRCEEARAARLPPYRRTSATPSTRPTE